MYPNLSQIKSYIFIEFLKNVRIIQNFFLKYKLYYFMNWAIEIISKALMAKISHVSWGGYDKGFYGIEL